MPRLSIKLQPIPCPCAAPRLDRRSRSRKTYSSAACISPFSRIAWSAIHSDLIEPVFRLMPIEVGRPVHPPDRPAPPGACFTSFTARCAGASAFWSLPALGIPDRPLGRHRALDARQAPVIFDIRIGHPPWVTAHDEIASIGLHLYVYADFRRARGSPAGAFQSPENDLDIASSLRC